MNKLLLWFLSVVILSATLVSASIVDADVVENGVIDLNDLLLVVSQLNLVSGDAGFNPRADVNRDDIVNLLDLVSVASYFGQSIDSLPAFSPFANMPEGWTILREYDFSDAIPAGNSELIADSGFWTVGNAPGNLRRIVDESAPISPPYVLEWLFPAGRTSGNGIGSVYTYIPSSDRVYVSFSMWHDEEFEFHPISNKLVTFKADIPLLQAYHSSGYFELNYQGQSYPPNIVPDYMIPRGEWIQVEYLADAVDNHLQVWVDGVLISDRAVPFGGGWTEVMLDSVWGGSGSPGSRDSYRRVGHIVIAMP